MSWGMLVQPLVPGTMWARAFLSGVGGALFATSASALTFGMAERYLRRKLLERRREVETLIAAPEPPSSPLL